MASNSFEPDSIPVKGYNRKPPTKKKPVESAGSSFESDDYGIAPPQPPVPLTEGERGMVGMLPHIAGAVGTMLAPELAAPAWLLKAAQGARFAGPALKALPGVLSRATTAGAAGAGAEGLVEATEGKGLDLGRILQTGGQQAALSVGGDALVGAVAGVGHLGMQAALKSFPEEAAIAIREGIRATRGGLRKLYSKIGDISGQTKTLTAKIAKRGGGFDTKDLANKIEQDVLADLGHSSTSSNKLPELDKIRRRFIDQNPGTLPADEAHKFFKSANTAAEPQFVKLANGEKMMLPTDPVEQLWKKHEAERLREALEGASTYLRKDGTMGSEFADLNSRQHELLKLKNVLDPEDVGFGARALRQGLSRGTSAAVGASTGASLNPTGDRGNSALLGALAGGLAGSPGALSQLSLLLNNPLILNLLKRTPQAGAALVAE